MSDWCRKIADDARFQGFIIALIIFNAVLVGLETNSYIDEQFGGLIDTLESVILAIFVVEITIRLLAYLPRVGDFFKDLWNLFDFMVVAVSLLPAVGTMGMVARLARVLRLLRLFSRQRRLLGGAAVVAVLYLVAGVSIAVTNYQNRVAAALRHAERMVPTADDIARTPPPGHEKDVPVKVRIGIYLDRIGKISLKEATWTADFYVWFNWKGDDINPGETFHVIDGKIESKEKVKKASEGDEHYALYRVTAEITRFFNVTRYPVDDHVLTISIEDLELQSYQLEYEADEKGSTASSRVQVPGYTVRPYTPKVGVKPHSYKTRRGDPDLPEDYRATYSQAIFAIELSRPDYGFYMKMFLGLFVAVAIALLVFFIKPTDVDPRFGLGVGALFACIANMYITSTLLPDTGVLTLTDMVNSVSIMTVFVTLLQSTISLYIFDIQGDEALSRRFDRESFWLFFIAYTFINIAIPIAAKA